MDNVTFQFLEKLAWLPLHFYAFARFPAAVSVFWKKGALTAVYFYCFLAMQNCSYRGTKVKTEKAITGTWTKEKREWVSGKDEGPRLPLHLIMLLIWCVTRWCTADNYLSTAALREKKALAPLSPAHMRSDEHKHIKKKKSNQNKTSLLPFARTAWASLQPVEHKAEIRWIKAPCLSLYLPSKMSTIQGVLGSGSNQIPLLYQSVRPLIPFDTTSFH